MAEDVHVTETGLRRPPDISCWINPVAFGKLAVQAAAGHDQSLFCSHKMNAINKATTQHMEKYATSSISKLILLFLPSNLKSGSHQQSENQQNAEHDRRQDDH